MDARGVIFSAGARVVKNAAGYNLCRLLVGSLGTLAVMTQATLMVKPLPETSAFVVCEVDDWDAGDRLLTALIRGPALPTAIELLAGPAWRADPWWEPWNPPTKARLAVGLEGSAKEVAWQIEQLQSAWQAEGVRHIQTFPDTPAQQIWRRLTEFPLGPALGGSARPASPGPEGVPLPFAEIQKEGSTPFGSPSEPGSARETIVSEHQRSQTDGGSSPVVLGNAIPHEVSEPQSAQTDDSLSEAQGSPYLIVEAGVLPSQVLPLTVRWLKIDPQVSVLAHAGHGSLIGYFPAAPAETGRCLRELILPAVAAWKGHVRVLDAPAGAQWTGEDLWNVPSLPHRLVQGIKKCFDPHGILNPGRLGLDFCKFVPSPSGRGLG